MLPGRRVVFVPVPKTACTSIMWLLAKVAGYGEDHFYASVFPAVSRIQTIHDISLWDRRHRWATRSPEEQEAINADSSWLRFAIVRDPAPRLFSAWQSKLLLREPNYFGRYTAKPWFPRLPRDPDMVVEDFRTFVRSLALDEDDRPFDVHWGVQAEILDAGPRLNHIGRVEELAATMDVVRGHLGAETVDRIDMPWENRGLIRYDPAVYDAETAAIANQFFRRDLEEFGYEPVEPGPGDALEAWKARTGAVLPAVAILAERHERIKYLRREAKRVAELEEENAGLRTELQGLRPRESMP
jgi:hypothetical protein